jgi:hypothetical protein
LQSESKPAKKQETLSKKQNKTKTTTTTKLTVKGLGVLIKW